MTTITDIWKWFGDRTVLRGVSVELRDGELLGLVGPSNSGKSVLLKIIGGVLEPDTGSVSFSDSGRGESVGFSFQEGALFDSLSVIDNVAFPLLIRVQRGHLNLTREEILRSSYEILDEVGLGRDCDKVPGQLSGGMRRRLAIARALVTHPQLVLLDDPTGGLDPVAASVIMDLIKRLHKHYVPTMVIVSHDIRRLLPSVDRIIALFDGQIVCDQTLDDLRSKGDPRVIEFLSTRYDFSC